MELSKEYLDKRLAAFATREEMQQEFAQLRTDLASKEDISKLYNRLDDLIEETRTYHQEFQVLRYQVQTMREWIEKVAQKIRIEYKP